MASLALTPFIPKMSPFEPIEKWLRFFQIIGGFPFKMTEKATNFFFSLGHSFLVIAHGLVTLLIVFVYLAEDSEIKENVETHVTITEVMSDYFTEWPQFFPFFINWIFAFSMAPKLTDFATKLKNLTADIPIARHDFEYQTYKNKAQWILVICNILAAALSSAASIFLLSGDDVDFTEKIVTGLLEIYINSFILTPLSFIPIYLMISQAISHLSLLVGSLSNIAQDELDQSSLTTKKHVNILVKPNNFNNQKWLTRQVELVVKAIRDFNVLFGLFLFMEIGICMCNLTASAFLLYSSVEHLTNNPDLGGVEIAHDAHHILLPIIWLLRLIFLNLQGELLLKNVDELKGILTKININAELGYESHSMEISIKKLRHAKIKPFNGFVLSLTTLLSSVALLATYIVILFQFRDEEVKCHAQLLAEKTAALT